MIEPASRRSFLKRGASLAALGLLARPDLWAESIVPAPAAGAWFDISLAQWSLHRAFRSGEKDSKRFAQIAKSEFGIRAVEYVNQFYKTDFSPALVSELARVSQGEGVENILIMCDGEGALDAQETAAREEAVENHLKWIEMARALGCHGIRVNLPTAGKFDEQLKLAADGLRSLCERADRYGINVMVENHGGLSSNAAWLAAVMRRVDHPRCGTLPDFGNFTLDRETGATYDRYLGIEQLMPFAKGVSAKTYDFLADGSPRDLDYGKLLGSVKASGYRGHIGIEYEGRELDEPTGILKTKQLLQKSGGRV